jgi:hypothetical protein
MAAKNLASPLSSLPFTVDAALPFDRMLALRLDFFSDAIDDVSREDEAPVWPCDSGA